MSRREGTIALVPPRFGPEVVGGAEAVIAELGRSLAQRGWNVEILTTCAVDHFTWANEFPPGVTEVDGMTVRRFPTELTTPGKHRDAIGGRILNGDFVSISDQQLWMNDSLRVSGLWRHVFEQAETYRAIIPAPYMFWTTFAVGQIAPERTILMPCLHDEPPAKLELFKPLFSDARGVLFLSEPEAELAASLFRLPPRHAVVGSAMHLPASYDPDAFRRAYGIDEPFIFYAGRREWGKGWTSLVQAYGEAVVHHGLEMKLVTSGVGQTNAPPELLDRVVDLGFLSDHDRDNAMAAASVYVQPSALESFSRTVLEAWAAGTLVIANAKSEVVAWHVARSKAGLTYRSNAELVECLRFAAEEPAAAAALAAPGADYVRRHYAPAVVLDRIEGLIEDWTVAP